MQRVVFDMSFAVDVPEGTADRLARLMETFINEVCRIIPTPKMHVGIGEICSEERATYIVADESGPMNMTRKELKKFLDRTAPYRREISPERNDDV